MLDTPRADSRSKRSLVTRAVALGAAATVIFLPRAYSTISKRSRRMKGSPPLNTTIGG
jgi:hypothetical protein